MPARRYRLWILGIVWILNGCASLPHPTPADAERARGRWPLASVASLESGRTTYAAKCASCHALYSPQKHTPQEWRKALTEMAERAHLTAAEREDIEQFLDTMSAHRP
jgi:cytochrome c5